MAGAMPQQRGGSNATTIGMVVSIIVAVLLLGVLIWLITQQEQLRNNASTAQSARDRAVRDSEEFKRAAGLVISGMTGDANDTPQAARDKLEAMLATIRSDGRVADADQMTSSNGAVVVIERLHQLYKAEMDAREKLVGDLAKVGADLRTALAANTELQQKFGDDLASLRVKVEELQAAKSDFERLKSSETQALASQIGAKQDALDAMRREQMTMRQRMRDELLHREGLLHEQREALARLRAPGVDSAAQELAVARTGVGTILRALPGDSLVHIDLGREDGVRLGMTFAVYSALERIPEDGRGKAHIEVVSVGRRTAECRVTTPPSPDNPLLEGDLVGNIILSRDKSKKQRFCIVGQFDIDFDGQVDVRGAEAIAALVRRYGGEVVDRVDAMTDYVIVGLEPPEGLTEMIADEPELDLEETEETPAARPSRVRSDRVDSDAEEADDEDAVDENEDEAEEDTATDEDDSEDAADEDADDDEGEPAGDDYDADDAGDLDDTDEDTDVTAPSNRLAQVAAAPTIQRAPEVDPTKGPRARRVLTERERYRQAVERAMLLSIPRLPQDRFFNFIGLESGREAMRALEQ